MDANAARSFGALYAETYRPVRRYLARHLRVAEDVDDLTADVYARAWRAYDRYRDGGAPPLAWLYRIARNRLVDHVRARRAAVSLDAHRVLSAGLRQPGDAYARSDDADALARALGTLTDAQRVVITLRYLDGRRPREIAPVLHRNTEAVKKLQRRGLGALRRSFADAAIAQAEDDLGCAALPRPHRHPRPVKAR